MASKRTKSAPTPSPLTSATDGALATRAPTSETAKATARRSPSSARVTPAKTPPPAPKSASRASAVPSAKTVGAESIDSRKSEIVAAPKDVPPSAPAPLSGPGAPALSAPLAMADAGIASIAANDSPAVAFRPIRKVTSEERFRMIAEAAYGAAEREGFANDPFQTWLLAERLVDARLTKAAG